MEGIRPDIRFTVNNTTYMVDIAAVFDDADNLFNTSERELSKYSNLGIIIAIIVGVMGS